MENELTAAEILQRARALMPGVLDDLGDLVRYPSVAFPGWPAEPVHAMAGATAAVLKRYGLKDVRLMDIPGGYPAVYGEIPAPPGAPTILLYAHYDIQPARREDGWDTDPFEPVEKGGRLYGRGAADNKSGIMIIAACLKVFDGNPPAGVKILIEGEEETAGHLEEFVAARPAFFRCNAFVVADNGNPAAGHPALTTTLRGEVSCIIEVRTLDHAVHSGTFGGAAPDALAALIKILSTLHDARGNVAVQGLRSSVPGTADYKEEIFRQNAGVLPGVDLTGTGPLGSRLWAEPSVSVLGIDAPSVSGSSNILIPRASAKVSLRIAPDADPRHELDLLMDHLRSHVPWNARIAVRPVSEHPGFVCPAGGPAYTAAREALGVAFGRPAEEMGAGGSIPLMRALRDAVPEAEFILWGAADDACSQIHGTNESVAIRDLEGLIVAQSLFLQKMGKRKRD
jgi:acetylornithine deacetylase/succinyl-diaminopimelate desuccinylase-like protein